MSTWILTAHETQIGELIAAAGSEASILLIADDAAQAALKEAAVTTVVQLPVAGLAENAAGVAAAYLAELGAQTIIAADNPIDRSLATNVAARIGAAWISGAISWDADSRTVNRSIAGLNIETLTVNGPVAFVLPTNSPALGGNPELKQISTNEVPSEDAVVEILAESEVQNSGVDVSKSERVIGVGRGFAEREDLQLAEELAAKIGAQIGATRPLSEGYGWFDSYIGLTGQPVAAELYIAVGISGQIHHSGGIRESKVIVAINDDPQAPIFHEADYAIVGDLYEILPQLNSLLG